MIMIMMKKKMMKMTTTMTILVRICVALVRSEEANGVLQITTFPAELKQ